MSTEPRDETAEELEQRVDRLERVVKTQHDMMSELEESNGILGTYVGRRDAMQAGGMLGMGALIGGVGSQKAIGKAEASHGGGHVGTSANPVDVYGYDGEFETVSTGELNSIKFVDDISTLQSTLNTVRDAGGGLVFLEAGSYTYGDVIRIPENVRLAGAGKDATTITFTHSGAGVMVAEPDGTYQFANRTTVVRDVGLSDLTLDGGSTATEGLRLTGLQEFSCERVRIQNFTGDGVYGEGRTDATGLFYNVFYHLRVMSNGGRGFNFTDNGQAANSNTFLRCYVAKNDLEGFRMVGSGATMNANFLNVNLESNCRGTGASHELYFDTGASRNMFRGRIETAAQAAYFGPSCDYNSIDGSLAADSNPKWEFDSNAGGNNRIWMSWRQLSETTNSSGLSSISTVSNANVPPSIIQAQSISGRPVEIAGRGTDGSGNYTDVTYQLKNFDGTNASASERIWTATMFTGPENA